MQDEELQRLLLSETAQGLLSDIAQTHRQLDFIDQRLGLPVNYETVLPQRALAVQAALAGSVVVTRAAAVTALGATFLLGLGVGVWLARRAARRQAEQQARQWGAP